MAAEEGKAAEGERESLAEVLASIRALVSAEAEARTAAAGEGGGTVLMLTPEMRLGGGSLLAEGLESRRGGRSQAPILDEESLRDLINAIVREELQGELGERIGRNLRKLIRQEIAQLLDERERRG
jgi:hypothetical protein